MTSDDSIPPGTDVRQAGTAPGYRWMTIRACGDWAAGARIVSGAGR